MAQSDRGERSEEVIKMTEEEEKERKREREQRIRID